MARGEEDPLVVNQHFNYSNRPPRDVPWAVAFVLFLCATIAGGIYAIVNRYSETSRASTHIAFYFCCFFEKQYASKQGLQ